MDDVRNGGETAMRCAIAGPNVSPTTASAMFWPDQRPATFAINGPPAP